MIDQPSLELEDQTSAHLLEKMGGQKLAQLTHLKPPPFLFEGFARDNAITLISSEPHAGKTLLMLDMAICLDYRLPLFGRFAPIRPRRILILGGDAPDWDYGQQTLKLQLGKGMGQAQRDLCEVTGVFREGMKLTDPFVLKWIDDYWHAQHFDVLMLDTLLTFHRANENDNQQMGAVMSILKSLRQKYNLAILIAHHTTKPSRDSAATGGYSARGASVIAGAIDFHFILKRKAKRIYLDCVKGRGSVSDEPVDYIDMVDVPTTEVDSEGRSLGGIKLVAPQMERNSLLLSNILLGKNTIKELSAILAGALPLAKSMDEGQVYKYVDNGLQELRRLGKIEKGAEGWRMRG